MAYSGVCAHNNRKLPVLQEQKECDNLTMSNNYRPESYEPGVPKIVDNYWIGPYGMKVSKTVGSVFVEDGLNEIYQDKNQSDIYIKFKEIMFMSKEEYLQKFAFLGEDGHYYYDEKRGEEYAESIRRIKLRMPKTVGNYWIGPHGMRVPKTVGYIVAEDGWNTLCQDGSHTENGVSKIMSKEEYLRRFAFLGEDGHYYYVEKRVAR